MNDVLYLGDDTLETAAGYLGAVMQHAGIGFDYGRSDQPAGGLPAFRDRDKYNRFYRLLVLSDYPATMLSKDAESRVLRAVESGTGLLMIGGWESFHGSGGNYDSSGLSTALPVEIGSEDDRMNCSEPCIVIAERKHPILEGLSFDPAPVVGGFNRVAVKAGAERVLSVRRYRALPHSGTSESGTGSGSDVSISFSPFDENPLLVVGTYGKGRTAALTTDVAPHWVGGLVDWGAGRVSENIAGHEVEVGDAYVRFLTNLLGWTGGLASYDRLDPNDRAGNAEHRKGLG